MGAGPPFSRGQALVDSSSPRRGEKASCYSAVCLETSTTTTGCQIWCQPLCIRLQASYPGTFMAVPCQVQIVRENHPAE